MSKEFKLTDPGEGLQEAEILEVHVAAGDKVEDGDTVLTVETDKANTEIPAPFSGTVKEVRVSEGDTAQVGDVLMTYDDAEQDTDDNDQGDDEQKAADSKQDDSEQDTDEDEDENADDGDGDGDDADEEADTDASEGSESETDNSAKDGDEDDADAKDDDSDSDASEDNESETADNEDDEAEDESKGPQHEKNVEMGDIDEDDTEDSDDQETTKDSDKSDDQESQEKSEGDEASETSGHDKPVPAAPSTRRLAREKNVDLGDIEPSGDEGRVTAEDVEAAAQEAQGGKQSSTSNKGQKGSGSALIPGGGEAPALPDFSQWGEVERTPLRSIHRATAKNMARAWGQIPHVYHQDIADVTALDRFRREHEEAAEIDGGKFTLTVLVIKALASALKQFPRFSASLDVENQEIVLKHYCHIGLAVATDRGLLVPVIRDVDQKNLVQLSTEAAEIARKTRDGDIKRDDMQGGCITVTNPGSMGGSSLTPLINHPQVAILGMAQARLQPTVQGDIDNYTIEPRLQLPLILGFDHRVNDGAEAAQFVTYLKNSLADPESLLLNI